MPENEFNIANTEINTNARPLPQTNSEGYPLVMINGRLVEEPFRKLSDTNRHISGRYKIDVGVPKNAIFLGVFLVLAGIALGIYAVASLTISGIVTGIFLFIIFVGMGIFMLYIGIVRRRWLNAYFKR